MDLYSRKGTKDAKDSYGMSDLADLAAWREILHVDFLISQRRGGRKGFLRNVELGGLAAWRETLMIHARGFIFSQRRKGRKGFLRNVGLGGLCGLARDINDPRARIIFSQRRGGRKGFKLDNRLSEKNNKANIIYRHNN